MSRPVRALLFSTLYPSSVRPGHGIFVETRLRELLRGGEVESRVVAPVPWFPFTDARFGSYAMMARTPQREWHNGIEVHHPRYPLPAKVGMSLAPFSLALAAIPALKQMVSDGFDFDLIDAHYYYPDGVAAAILARHFGKPFVVTARGSDINLIADHAIPRRLILWAAARASASITVSASLHHRLISLGADAGKVHVLRNGVDLDLFRPLPMAQARARLGWADRTTILSVGNLVENKGHHIVIEAVAALLGMRLVIVGAGPEADALRNLAKRFGVADRVEFCGQVPQERLVEYYSAADAMVLASSREGWPNVVLEAMACGTPVIATSVGGVPEIIAAPGVGRLVGERSAQAFAAAIETCLSDPVDRTGVRAHAEEFGWAETSRRITELFHGLASTVRADAGESALPAMREQGPAK